MRATPTIEAAISRLGMTGRILDVKMIQSNPVITDDTKTEIFLQQAIPRALICPLCGGTLDPKKSLTYDHVERISEGGSGDISNVQLAHPYCNTGYKN
jgi:hypothetical protein